MGGKQPPIARMRVWLRMPVVLLPHRRMSAPAPNGDGTINVDDLLAVING
jgi:hypothetical protein